MMENWSKYTYLCTHCDALLEYTFKAGYTPNSVFDITCLCEGSTVLLSVADATILPTEKKEEQQMETTAPIIPQVMTLDWVENDSTVTKEYTESDVRHMVWQNKNLTSKQNEWYTKESKLRTLLHEVFVDSEDQEALEQIADIFDVSLTKEIEVTAYIRVDATIEVDIREGDYDLEDLIRNNLTVDSFGSEISVNDYDVERVEEGAY
jgi:hypothetical protein